MAAILDLLAQKIDRMSKKKIGRVFEEYLPECTPLYDIPVKKGTHVARKTGAVSNKYEVVGIRNGIATCYHKVSDFNDETV